MTARQAAEYFVTRSGRLVPERDTDQAGSEMLIRTVSRNADGTPRDRATVCVSPHYCGSIERAQREAEELDRRGYLPPVRAMTRDELARLANEQKLKPTIEEMVWDICGRGFPLPAAAERTFGRLDREKFRSLRRRLQRVLKAAGWDQDAQNPAA